MSRLPHIGEEFDASISALQWVLTGYLVALASLILLGGALGDRFGRRKVFVIGTMWFAMASLLCGAAPNIEVLIAARVLQGVGGALLTPGSLAILQASFRAVGSGRGRRRMVGIGRRRRRNRTVRRRRPGGRTGMAMGVPDQHAGRSDRDRLRPSAIPETRDPHAGRGLDLVGAALAVVGLAASTWALTEAGPHGWTNPGVFVAAVIAMAAIATFVRRMMHTSDPLVPPALFRNRTFTVVNLQTVAALRRARGVVLPRLVRAAGRRRLVGPEGRRRAAAGDRLDACAVGSSGTLAQRIGPRLQLTVGPIVAACGLLLLARIGEDTSWVRDVLPGAVVFGLGLVTFVAPLTATVMAAADPDHVSVASGVNNAIARAAGLSALAVIPVVSGLTSAVDPAEITHAFRVGMVITACIAAAAGPLAFFGLAPHVNAPCTARRVHCAIDGAPLQPEPQH